MRPTSLLATALLWLSVPARAQVEEHPRFPAERLQLASDRNGLVDVEWAEILPRGAIETFGWAGSAREPLVVRDRASGERIGDLVRSRAGGEVGASWAPIPRAQVSFALPFVLAQERPAHQPRVAAVDLPDLAHAGPGDLRLSGKVALLQRRDAPGLSVAVVTALSVPSGGSTAYRGEAGMTFLPKVAVGWGHPEGLRVGANVGAVVRRAAHVLDQTAASELTFGLGAGRRLGRLDVAASLSGAVSAARPFARSNESSLEARSMATVRLGRHLDLFGGGGLGLLIGWGTPRWRLFGGLRVPLGEQAGAAAAEPPPPPAPAPPPPAVELPPSVAEPPPELPAEPPPAPVPVEAPPVVPGPAPAAPPPTPPAPAPAVRLRRDRIEILGEIRFATDSDVIVARSLPVLDEVVGLLNAHPEVERLRIEGHTDDRGSPAHNLDLSRRRAAAAVRYLVHAGVDPARLESVGLGAQRPVAPNATAAGRARNRRLEFMILSGERAR